MDRYELPKRGPGQSSRHNGTSVVIWAQETCVIYVVHGLIEGHGPSQQLCTKSANARPSL